MVMGYACPEHGVHTECDVAKDGERICPEGAPTAVTGIVGENRRYSTLNTAGYITWRVYADNGRKSVLVEEVDLTGALREAAELLPKGSIDRIHPENPGDRR